MEKLILKKKQLVSLNPKMGSYFILKIKIILFIQENGLITIFPFIFPYKYYIFLINVFINLIPLLSLFLPSYELDSFLL